MLSVDIGGTGITQHDLKNIINYDPHTGVFKWISSGKTCGWKTRKHGKSYISIMIHGRTYISHRLAFLYMMGSFPKEQVDHINGNGCDNRWINIRESSALENGKNKRLYSTNKSGISGVCWKPRTNMWEVQVRSNRVRKHLGSFDNIFDAACVRKNALIDNGYHKNHGSIRDL